MCFQGQSQIHLLILQLNRRRKIIFLFLLKHLLMKRIQKYSAEEVEAKPDALVGLGVEELYSGGREKFYGKNYGS